MGTITMKKIGTILLIILLLNFFSINIIAFENHYYNDEIDPPLIPGCMKNDEIEIIRDYTDLISININKIYTSSLNELVVSLIQQIDENIYLGYLENLTSFGPRLTTTEACDDSAEYIFNEFEKLGLETRYHEWSNDYLFGSNVEATLPGIDEHSDEIYVICAHYDSVDGSPGADDDGSGTAAVLTAAKVMSLYSFNHTIRFVAFSGEEQGLYGSGFYVQEAVENNDNIIAALNIDMIGFALSEEDESILELYEDDASQWLADYTVDISQQYNEYFDLEVMLSGYSWGSDHYRFWEAGYNAIFYAEYNFNDYYHSQDDTIEHMNIPYATRATKLIIATLAELTEVVESKNAPLKPDTPSGPINGKFSEEYNYSTSTIDVDGNIVYYYWDWGDGSSSDWIGPYNSGEEITLSHIWNKRGDYSIKVKAKDDEGFESLWSDPLVTSMPRNQLIINQYLLKIFEIFTFLNSGNFKIFK
jgi:hypothetical protein